MGPPLHSIYTVMLLGNTVPVFVRGNKCRKKVRAVHDVQPSSKILEKLYFKRIFVVVTKSSGGSHVSPVLTTDFIKSLGNLSQRTDPTHIHQTVENIFTIKSGLFQTG